MCLSIELRYLSFTSDEVNFSIYFTILVAFGSKMLLLLFIDTQFHFRLTLFLCLPQTFMFDKRKLFLFALTFYCGNYSQYKFLWKDIALHVDYLILMYTRNERNFIRRVVHDYIIVACNSNFHCHRKVSTITLTFFQWTRWLT